MIHAMLEAIYDASKKRIFRVVCDSDAKYQRALAHFHSDAQALKRGMATALFVQRFKQGLIKPA